MVLQVSGGSTHISVGAEYIFYHINSSFFYDEYIRLHVLQKPQYIQLC